MKIEQIIKNLENTIAGKKNMLEGMYPNNPYVTEFMSDKERVTHQLTAEFLTININELARILADLRKANTDV